MFKLTSEFRLVGRTPHVHRSIDLRFGCWHRRKGETVKPSRFALALGGSMFAASGALAQTPNSPTAKPPSVPAAAGDARPRGSAIQRIGSDVVQDLGGVPVGALVVASALVTDLPAPKSDELAVRIAMEIAGRIGRATAHGRPAALPVARGLSGGAASLVYLQLEISKGTLRVTADLYPAVSNGWDRLRNPAVGPHAHAFATAPIDAEIRTFFAPVLLEQAKVRSFTHDEGELVALGCGDVDGDGGNELVLVTRLRVAVAKIKDGKLTVQRTAAWRDLAPRVPVPMREPLASVLVSPPGHPGEILLGTTDRGGVVLDASLVARRFLAGIPIPGGGGDACAIPNAELSAFEGPAVACEIPAERLPSKATKSAPIEAFAPPATRFDAMFAVDAIEKDGSVRRILATRETGGTLRVSQRGAAGTSALEMKLEGTGGQIALADLDLDGVVEIITTSEIADDVVVVASLARGGVTPRLRFPAKDGVRAIGVCPPEDRGVPALVAAVGNEVWIVR